MQYVWVQARTVHTYLDVLLSKCVCVSLRFYFFSILPFLRFHHYFRKILSFSNSSSFPPSLLPSFLLFSSFSLFFPINNFWRSIKGEAGEGEISTEQVINDLNSQCRAYCDSPDPYVTLNIGSVLTHCNAKFCGNLQHYLILFIISSYVTCLLLLKRFSSLYFLSISSFILFSFIYFVHL